MSQTLYEDLDLALADLRDRGLYKAEHPLQSPQGAHILTEDGRSVVNLCANNYLGLANHPEILAAARRGLDERGFGMASVRFICGTQDIHQQLERALSRFLGTEDTLLYSSCFDANGGLFEPILDERDAVISDALNHASIIDGIRLCKARRLRYSNSDMAALERCLRDARDARRRLIATDGVFSMDGSLAHLDNICDLARRHDALVMVDDSHGVGVLGPGGRGTHEHLGVLGRVDILTGTLGKALGGAAGGYVSGRARLVDWLRQSSRPYLFSNALAPPVVYACLKALEMLEAGGDLRRILAENARHFRSRLRDSGFSLAGEDHPIIPVMVGEARLAGRMARELWAQGIYAVAFSYPVVPQGQARIRTQMSALHSRRDLDQAADAFAEVGRRLGVLP